MKLSLHNRQTAIPIDLRWLRKFSRLALQECLQRNSDSTAVLRSLSVIEITIVSDRAIAEVHRSFFNLESATDVITFDHGEIVISAETAQSHAAQFGTATQNEIALYIIHGLLHLDGFTDDARASAAVMKTTQDEILRELLGRLPSIDGGQ